MKINCPACGALMSLELLFAHDGAREAMLALMRFGGAPARRTVKYLGLFRPKGRDLSFERFAKILNPLLDDMERGYIERNRKQKAVTVNMFLEAMEIVMMRRDEGKLETPLKNHGYLYEVIMGLSCDTQVVRVENHLQIEEKQDAFARARANLEAV